MGERVAAAQEMIFRPGDPSDFAYVIQSGSVEILKSFPEKPSRLALLQDGEIFGEMGLVDERPRTLAARALSETRLTTVTREEFVDMILERPQESLKYLRTLFERLRAMNTRVAGEAALDTQATSRPPLLVTLIPLTDRARESLPREGLRLTRFPYRIGRLSQHNPESDPLQINDLSLPDESPFNVSKNHLAIEIEHGRVVVRDRGSYLGTVVNGTSVGGGHRGASAVLLEGDNEMALGSSRSPFRFRIVVKRPHG
jgi:CRP/FNR family transcriptional regulator, cyclic AMP receptor protein